MKRKNGKKWKKEKVKKQYFEEKNAKAVHKFEFVKKNSVYLSLFISFLSQKLWKIFDNKKINDTSQFLKKN